MEIPNSGLKGRLGHFVCMYKIIIVQELKVTLVE